MHRASSAPGVPTGQPVPPPRRGYLTPEQAADFTGISKQELERYRRQGGGPLFCRVSSRLIRYAVDDLCAWMDSFKVANTSQGVARA